MDTSFQRTATNQGKEVQQPPINEASATYMGTSIL